MSKQKKIQNQKQQGYELQKEVWDLIAGGWTSFRQKPLGVVEDFAKEWKPGKILDVGCGNCRNLKPFADLKFDCYGIDFSKNMVSVAKDFLKKHNIQAKVYVEKAEKLPFKDNSFDYVLALRVIPCILTEKERSKALDEVKRVLKKNGKAIITIWNKTNFKYLLSKKEALVPWRKKDRTLIRYYYLYSPAEITKILVEKGFKILRTSNPLKEEFYAVVQNA